MTTKLYIYGSMYRDATGKVPRGIGEWAFQNGHTTITVPGMMKLSEAKAKLPAVLATAKEKGIVWEVSPSSKLTDKESLAKAKAEKKANKLAEKAAKVAEKEKKAKEAAAKKASAKKPVETKVKAEKPAPKASNVKVVKTPPKQAQAAAS